MLYEIPRTLMVHFWCLVTKTRHRNHDIILIRFLNLILHESANFGKGASGNFSFSKNFLFCIIGAIWLFTYIRSYEVKSYIFTHRYFQMQIKVKDLLIITQMPILKCSSYFIPKDQNSKKRCVFYVFISIF